MFQISEFLSSVCVVDTETTGLDPTTAEIVEMACAHYVSGNWSVESQLFNTSNGIPPEASAKNQISRRMLLGQPLFDSEALPQIIDMLGMPKYFVAHNVNYDQKVLSSSFERMGEHTLAVMFQDPNSWICTWRLSKHIYQHSFTDKIYNQNYLRYKLDLPVPDSIGVHRAGADVQVCGALLERIVEDSISGNFVDPTQPIGAQLVELSRAPIIYATWPLGKYRGQTLNSIPTDYFLWAIENQGSLRETDPGYDFDLAESVRQELETRLSAS